MYPLLNDFQGFVPFMSHVFGVKSKNSLPTEDGLLGFFPISFTVVSFSPWFVLSQFLYEIIYLFILPMMSLVPIPLVEKATFHPKNCFCTFAKASGCVCVSISASLLCSIG